MKRYGISILIISVIVSILGLAGATTVWAQRDDIFVTDHSLSGNQDIVKDVSFAVTSQYYGTELLWDLDLPLSNPGAMTVAQGDISEHEGSKEELSLVLYDNMVYQGEYGLHGEDFYWQDEAIWAVGDNTAPGEVHSETLELGKYDPYFNLDGHGWFDLDDQEFMVFRDKAISEISAYLNIPTQGHQATIAVTKDKDDAIISVDYEMVGDTPKPTVLSLALDGVGYVYVERTAQEPAQLHAITFGLEKDGEAKILDTRCLETLPKGFHANYFFHDGENLLCLGENTLYVYPLETGEGYFLDSPKQANCLTFEGALLLVTDGNFLLYTNKSGTYTLDFQGKFTLPQEYWDSGYYYLEDQVYCLNMGPDFSDIRIQCIQKDGQTFQGQYDFSQIQEQSYINPNRFKANYNPNGPGDMVLHP